MARRLRDRFSRSREKKAAAWPRIRLALGGSPSPVRNIACHVLATGADSSVGSVAEVSIASLRAGLLARADALGFAPRRPPSSATTSSTPSCAEPRPTAPNGCAGSRGCPTPTPIRGRAGPVAARASPAGTAAVRLGTWRWRRPSTARWRPPRPAPGSSSSSTASPPAGWAGSPSGWPGAASSACSRRHPPRASSTPMAARRSSAPTRSVSPSRVRASQRWWTCRWADHLRRGAARCGPGGAPLRRGGPPA